MNNKPIPKSLRFKILKRDGYRCRYCGRSSSEVELHVDHVLPRVLDGSNDPLNLVTACVDCNLGKSTLPPGVPESGIVGGMTIKLREQLDAFDELAEIVKRRDELFKNTCDEFYSRWHRGTLPYDWDISIKKFLESGLPPHVIFEMIEVAENKYGQLRASRFDYFRGCCKRKLEQLRGAETDAKR